MKRCCDPFWAAESALVWAAIDALADRHGLSASALAIKAGLDATTFNKSKRSRREAPQWPSSESIARALVATDSTWADFAELVAER